MKEGKKQRVSILECTLRDGSYVIDYQFTSEDTYIVCLGLKMAGFKHIEIGHGTGLGSSKAGLGKSAATDEAYLEAARAALEGSDSIFGMFFIPGIGTVKDLELAAKYGMKFVRIGVNVTEIKKAKEFVEKAKSFGMKVSMNLMKSYAVPIDEFVGIAKKADEYGADIITLVDSAGGMFPSEVREYVNRLKAETDREIGFHGHNNLQLAIANTLEAVRAGANIVDSSLQGMGRSAGNTQTEILVMILDKLGYSTGIDIYRTLDMGKRIIRPMMSREQGVDDVSIVSGIAQFHSSFYKYIRNASGKYNIDPRMLIMEVSKVERINLTQDIVEKVALKIAKEECGKISKNDYISINSKIVGEKMSTDSIEQVNLMVERIFELSRKTGKESVFSLTLSKRNQTAFPFVRYDASYVIGNVEAKDILQAEQFIAVADGKVNWILIDESNNELRESKIGQNIKLSQFTGYSEERALHLSVSVLLSQRHAQSKVLILCDEDNRRLLKIFLCQQGISVYSMSDGKSEEILTEVAAVVSFGKQYASRLTLKDIPFISKDVVIYAARPGAFESSFWQALLERGQFLCRVDESVGLSVELALCIETKKKSLQMGSREFFGTRIVSGGVIGQRGNAVVDSVQEPARLIGIADGQGGLLLHEDEKEYQKTKNEILKGLVESLYQKKYDI